MNTEGSVAAKPITEDTLFYGDNLAILRESIDTDSVDLLYFALHACLLQNFVLDIERSCC
jgi:hypothetical protein